jgi:hypothetical protein
MLPLTPWNLVEKQTPVSAYHHLLQLAHGQKNLVSALVGNQYSEMFSPSVGNSALW